MNTADLQSGMSLKGVRNLCFLDRQLTNLKSLNEYLTSPTSAPVSNLTPSSMWQSPVLGLQKEAAAILSILFFVYTVDFDYFLIPLFTFIQSYLNISCKFFYKSVALLFPFPYYSSLFFIVLLHACAMAHMWRSKYKDPTTQLPNQKTLKWFKCQTKNSRLLVKVINDFKEKSLQDMNKKVSNTEKRLCNTDKRFCKETQF